MFIRDLTRASRRSKCELVHGGEFQCDFCGSLFEKWSPSVVIAAKECAHHYCSNQCRTSNFGNVLKEKCMREYGKENCMQVESIKHKMRETKRDVYAEGSEQRKLMLAKRRSVLFARYGTDQWSQIPAIRVKMSAAAIAHKATLTKQQKADWRKHVHETMKLRGSFRSSKPEESCFAALCARYGEQNVERQVMIEGSPKAWVFDFHVKEPDFYLQVDGVYWHGLDRQITEIGQSAGERDAFIFARYVDDRAQDAWFESQRLLLVRVTDQDVLAHRLEEKLL